MQIGRQVELTMLEMTSEGLKMCLKLKMARPRYANTHVSDMKASVRKICWMVILVTDDKFKWV